jgi:hypothetical protein
MPRAVGRAAEDLLPQGRLTASREPSVIHLSPTATARLRLAQARPSPTALSAQQSLVPGVLPAVHPLPPTISAERARHSGQRGRRPDEPCNTTRRPWETTSCCCSHRRPAARSGPALGRPAGDQFCLRVAGPIQGSEPVLRRHGRRVFLDSDCSEM